MPAVGSGYTLGTVTALDFDDAVGRVRDELAETAAEVRRRLARVVQRTAAA